jgi:hypothetical protein
MMTSTVTIKTLNELPPLNWMTMYSDQYSAEEAALERGEPFVWYFPPNGMYYVAVKNEA